MTKLPSGLQFSLVELLVLIAFAGLGAAAIRSGGALAAALLQAALWTSAAMVVVAIFSRQGRQAFAVGFLIGAATYVGPVLYVGEKTELDPHETKLPLTQPALALFAAMGAEAWVYEPTGERFDAFTTEVTSTSVSSAIGPGLFPSPPSTVYTLNDGCVVTIGEETPPRAEFMLAMHAFLTVAGGYLVGKFATVIYRRRNAQQEEATAASAPLASNHASEPSLR